MNRLLMGVFLLASTVPLYAQAQQPNAAKFKADAQKVVSMISRDKLKAQTYCEMPAHAGTVAIQVQAAAR